MCPFPQPLAKSCLHSICETPFLSRLCLKGGRGLCQAIEWRNVLIIAYTRCESSALCCEQRRRSQVSAYRIYLGQWKRSISLPCSQCKTPWQKSIDRYWLALRRDAEILRSLPKYQSYSPRDSPTQFRQCLQEVKAGAFHPAADARPRCLSCSLAFALCGRGFRFGCKTRAWSQNLYSYCCRIEVPGLIRRQADVKAKSSGLIRFVQEKN